MRKLLFSLMGLVLAAPAYALPINSPVPTNAYISFDGLDWAWGGPCPYSGGCFATGDLTYQSTQGWRLPTTAELSAIPTNFANDFVFAGANVPLGGSDPVSGATFTGSPPAAAACATPYFNTAATWCDWGDGASGDWAGAPGSGSFAEQLYVRGAAVPE
ncbi:MAG: hypothetical protein ACREF3_13790, partial [Acetobacteraceae bacterium]